MTDVDGCEREPDQAWQVNVEGSRYVAAAAAEIGAHVVFVSTDYVYSGERGPYRETDAPDPRSVYGKTKLAAEQAILELCPTAAIARTSTLYGYATGVRANFVTWLVGQLEAGKEVTVVTDQISSPTLAENLAEMLLALAIKRASGIFHCVGADWMPRFDFACAVADVFDLDRYLIRPGRTVDLHQLAPRPAHSGLFVDKIRELDVDPLPVREALRDLRRQMAKAVE
jgi:dTDP-4-dehydrorhamnose reductase